MQYDDKYQEELSRMEWEGGIIKQPAPIEISVLQKLINKLRAWLNQNKI